MQQAWADGLFGMDRLTTAEGEALRVLEPGIWNHDQGPDFLHGRIELDGVVMLGDIELHLDSKDWYRHGHHIDRQFDGVVLHVVMDESPKRAFRTDGTKVPVVSLHGKIHEKLAKRAQEKASKDVIACTAFAKMDLEHVHGEMLSYHGNGRVKDRLARVRRSLEACGMDWEEAFWRELMAVVAGKPNASTFREIAEGLPFKVLRHHAHDVLTLGVLLRGVAGLVSKGNNDWDEWQFLRIKHGLSEVFQPIKKSRMRPASFPVARMALVVSLVRVFPTLTDLFGMEGWERFRIATIPSLVIGQGRDLEGRALVSEASAMGAGMKLSLAINVLLPFGAAYFEAHGMGNADAILGDWLKQLPSEANKVVRKFQRAGWHADNALHSQAMIHLDRSRCGSFACDSCPCWIEIASRARNVPRRKSHGPK